MEIEKQESQATSLETQNKTVGRLVGDQGQNLLRRLALKSGVAEDAVDGYLEELFSLPYPIEIKELQRLADKYGAKGFRRWSSSEEGGVIRRSTISIYGPKGGTYSFPGPIYK